MTATFDPATGEVTVPARSMKRLQPLTFDPVLATQRAERRAARRAAAGPRPEDVAREKRREAAQTGNQPRATLERKPTATKRRRPISPASPEQRAAVANRACVVCREQPTDPAHLIPRGLAADGDGDPRAVVALCRTHHRLFDEGGFDLLPYLEPFHRAELAFAVERVGLMATVRRVTNDRNAAASVSPSMKP